MPIRMFKYRLYPNKVTAHKLQWTLDRCRELYNAALTERRDVYHFHVKQHPGYHDEETRKRLTRELAVNYYQQKRDLTLIKHELREEYKGIASQYPARRGLASGQRLRCLLSALCQWRKTRLSQIQNQEALR